MDAARGRVSSVRGSLPLRPQGRLRRPGRTADSPGAPRGTRCPQRSWCAPAPSRGSPTGGGVSDGRTQEAGAGAAGGGSRTPGCLSGFQNARDPENGYCCAGLSLASGTVNGLGGLGLAEAQGFSRPEMPRKSAVASAAPGPSAPQHPLRGTASARLALTPAAPLDSLRSPGEGGDTKAPRRSQSDACFPGRRGQHLPLELTVPPIGIGTGQRPGTLGAVVGLRRMLQTFARGVSQITGNTRQE